MEASPAPPTAAWVCASIDGPPPSWPSPATRRATGDPGAIAATASTTTGRRSYRTWTRSAAAADDGEARQLPPPSPPGRAGHRSPAGRTNIEQPKAPVDGRQRDPVSVAVAHERARRVTGRRRGDLRAEDGDPLRLAAGNLD